MDTAEPVVSDAPEDIAAEPVAPELEEPELEAEEPAELEAEEPEPTVEEPASASEPEEAPPPPKRHLKAAPKSKAEPKRRGRPPGSRNREPLPVSVLPQYQDPMEALMTTMRERRQAHQERQHSFFQSFLP